jgi:bifunctional non-homologous end joining protein LigD
MPAKRGSALKTKTSSAPVTSREAGRSVKINKTEMPQHLSPMLATLIDKPFDKPGWIYEVKWDGYRALAYVNKKLVDLRSRNDKSFNEKFYPVHVALSKLGVNAILDGEVMVADDKGHANFGNLQNWRSEADGDLRYYVFDLLWLNGESLMEKPLVERRAMLTKLLPEKSETVFVSADFEATGAEFFEMAKAMNLEGIIAKRADSEYIPGARSPAWVKIKTSTRQEVIIGGYTSNEGSSKLFSSLLVGVMKNGKLQYTGKIGTGFTQKMQQEMMKKFKPLIRKSAAFEEVPDINKPSRFRPDPPKASATWLKPELIAEVSYRELTSDGVMRHPSFEGMREDKKAKEVVLEVPKSLDEISVEDSARSKIKTNRTQTKIAQGSESAGSEKKLIKSVGGAAAKSGQSKAVGKKSDAPVRNKALNDTASSQEVKLDTGNLFSAGVKKDRGTLLNPSEERQVKKMNGHLITFTNLSKVYWPDQGYTKRDMLNYYYQVAPLMLPYLKDRPQSLNRHPNGIAGKSFYQKDVSGKVPDWIQTFPYHSEEDGRDKEFLVCSNEASLLYMASLGTIEMNPWSSRVQLPDNPDWCVIDLDPDKNDFDQVIEAANVTREILEAIAVPSYPKTSGSTGLHIYIPLGAKYDYEHSKGFARMIVRLVNERIPDFTSIERLTANRRGRIYLDFLQNRPQATLAAPYSVRPKPFAPVSMPLHWEEVKKGLRIQNFTIMNAMDRLKSTGDLFKPVLGKGIDMKKVIKKLEALLNHE